MFRTTSAQSSLFEVTNYFPGALPDDDWSFVFKEKVLPLIDEEKFAHLYSENEGRPNASIRTMLSLLIFIGMENLTWRAVDFFVSETYRLDDSYAYSLGRSPNRSYDSLQIFPAVRNGYYLPGNVYRNHRCIYQSLRHFS